MYDLYPIICVFAEKRENKGAAAAIQLEANMPFNSIAARSKVLLPPQQPLTRATLFGI